ncbi:FAD/NAD(P)-binding oxidoreductase [Streptomyces sp. NPDC047002]|uniref:NAD(P)/FAD-dependent oxidoreductase n=1 Tax=Streptomyces sp. NPDC047002 TaxID=3155475 RepID=UPI003455ADE4
MTGDSGPWALGRVVVVGASVGGVRTAQALRSCGFTGELTVVGAESGDPYDKPPLSKELLTGTRDRDDIGLLRPEDAGAFTLRSATRATALDTGRRVLALSDGDELPYDALVIATGVRPRTLPGAAGRLVHTVREAGDSAALRERFAAREPVVVVGGGFVGAEVAASAAAVGCPVTLVEADAAPFARVLGPRVGALLADLHERNGVRVRTGSAVARVEGAQGDVRVTLADGTAHEAGTVVAGIGCVPDTAWLDGSGVQLVDGVVTDEHCAVVGHGRTYAVGDVARWYDRRTGAHRRAEHWTNATEQAELVARDLLRTGDGGPRPHHDTAPYFWSDQHGVRVQMVGSVSPGDRVEVLRCATRAGDRDIAVYERDGSFRAAVSFGWPRACLAARRAWRAADTAEAFRGELARLAASVTPLPADRTALYASAQARAGGPASAATEEGHR